MDGDSVVAHEKSNRHARSSPTLMEIVGTLAERRGADNDSPPVLCPSCDKVGPFLPCAARVESSQPLPEAASRGYGVKVPRPDAIGPNRAHFTLTASSATLKAVGSL